VNSSHQRSRLQTPPGVHKALSPIRFVGALSEPGKKLEDHGIPADIHFRPRENVLSLVKFTRFLESPSKQYAAADVIRVESETLPAHPHRFCPQAARTQFLGKEFEDSRTWINPEHFLITLNGIHISPHSYVGELEAMVTTTHN
jgi:hypothetical protein